MEADDMTEEELMKKLEGFPSSFDIGLMGNEGKIKILINKLTMDQKSTNKTQSETLKINNFLFYLYYKLGEFETAIEYCTKSLSLDQNNIIALSNKARYLLETGESVFDAEPFVRKLEKMKTNKDFTIKKSFAESEVAYCFSRMGPCYHQTAVDLYRKIIDNCPTTEYNWKFGLALTLIRQTHMFNSQAHDKYRPRGKVQEAMKLLCEVAFNTRDSDKILCAKAWMKLGQTAYKRSVPLPPEVSGLSYIQMFEIAFTLTPTEPFVLENYGKYLRYRNNLPESEELLRLALEVKPTCFACHHLALTLKRRVEKSEASSTKEITEPLSPLSKMVKCPKIVKIFPGNKLLLEAIRLLNKAVKIDNTALWMYYEMSLIYRMLDDVENAIKHLKQIIAKKNILVAEESLINVYEQLGLCLLEMSQSDSKSEEQRAFLLKDGKSKLQNAVEKQSKIVEKDPEFRSIWRSFPTLKQLLESSGKKSKSSKQLARLHTLMGYNRKALQFYKEAETHGGLSTDDYHKWLENHLKLDEYDAAATLLGMLECTSHFTEISKTLCIRVYLEGACNAYASADLVLANHRFRNAFDMAKGDTNKMPCATLPEEDVFDVQILHSCADRSKCAVSKYLQRLIKEYTGLKCTINSEDCTLINSLRTEAILEVMKNSLIIIIMTHESRECNILNLEHALQLNKTCSRGNVLTVADIPENVPEIANSKPFLNLPSLWCQVVPVGSNIPEDHKAWLGHFLSAIVKARM